MVAAVPIVGSTLPIGVGVAWANKLSGKNTDITVIYFGDGATEEGVFHESLDFASLFKLNILFVKITSILFTLIFLKDNIKIDQSLNWQMLMALK